MMAGGFDLKRSEERMLVLLADLGPTQTSTIREELGWEKNQRVNYRGKRVLGAGKTESDRALGLVTNDGDASTSTQELTWWLTDLGQEFVEQHRDDLEAPQTASEAIEKVREFEDTIDEFEQRLQSLEGTVGQLQSEVEGLPNEVNEFIDLSRRVNTIDEEANRRDYEIKDEVERLRGRVKTLESILLEEERDSSPER